MKLIVGLGNPGSQYKNTRHNIGFMFIDYYANLKKLDMFKSKFQGEFVKYTIGSEDVLLYRPFTYMNLSGNGVNEIASYFKVSSQDIVVIYDDKDLPLANLRLREKGNPGSHNGMKNITACLNTNDFKRIRVGIGSPSNGMNMADFVLSKFGKEEIDLLNASFENVAKAIDLFIENKFTIAMNKYNTGK